MTTRSHTNKKKCSKCGDLYQTGGYAHPSKCWDCAPAAVPRKKMNRWLCNRRNNK